LRDSRRIWDGQATAYTNEGEEKTQYKRIFPRIIAKNRTRILLKASGSTKEERAGRKAGWKTADCKK